jgi:hypothetical protein
VTHVATPPAAPTAPNDPLLVGRLRKTFLVAAVLLSIGTFIELASLRHWNDLEMFVPWIVAAAVIVGAVLLWTRPSTSTAWLARLVALGSAGGGMLGVFEHIGGNLDAGELDPVHGPGWESLSSAKQLWLAVSGGVGPAPATVPLMVTFAGFLLAAATIGWSWRWSRQPRPASPAA